MHNIIAKINSALYFHTMSVEEKNWDPLRDASVELLHFELRKYMGQYYLPA
jgi:hypothetical protein